MLYDVECGLVSPESARDEYGLVIFKVGRNWQADAAKTFVRRHQLAQSRGKPPMFDRGPHFEAEKLRGQIKYPDGWVDPDIGWYANSAGRIVSEAATTSA